MTKKLFPVLRMGGASVGLGCLCGCQGGLEGEMGGSALTALVQAFAEVVGRSLQGFLVGAVGILIFGFFLWIFMRKK